MLDVLLVKIQPTDKILEEFKSFPDSTKEPLSFKITVFNGNPLQFRADRKYYKDSESFSEKVKAINKELGVDYGGHAVAIDKYPLTRFKEGAGLTEYSGMSHYDFEADFENSGCDCLVLSVPGLPPIPLSKLRFSCDGVGKEGFTPDVIVFKKDAVLSVTLPCGEIKGIALIHCSGSALDTNASNLRYTMSFEKVSLPAVVLQKLLETKPQSEGEPREETHE